MNFYPELIERNGKSQYALYPTPGLAPFCNSGAGPVRALCSTQGRAFAISGAQFGEISAAGNFVAKGAVVNDNKLAQFAIGSTQLLTCSNGLAYVYNLQTGVFTVSPANLPANPPGRVINVGWTDQDFIALIDNGQIQLSALVDATTWNAANTYAISVFPDNPIAMIVDSRQPWFFSSKNGQVYYNSGDLLNPYQPIPGGFIEEGIGAAASLVRADNTISWIGGDERGQLVAWRVGSGSTPQRISDHGVEFIWQGYSTGSDATAYSYQDQGHIFWVINFPTANATWVYDFATQQWHERGFWNGNKYVAHRGQCHCLAFGKHLVGDSQSGQIYQMAIPQQKPGSTVWSFADDFGNPLRRMRRTPVVAVEKEWVYHEEIQFDVETGVGPMPPLIGPSNSFGYITLADPTGQLWQVTIDDNGNIQRAQTNVGVGQVLALLDSTTGTTVWQLNISAGGVVGATQVTANYPNPLIPPLPPQILSMATSGTAKQSGLTVSNVGVVAAVVPFAAARDPEILLRWSDDHGKTWSNEYNLGIGQAGAYKLRVLKRRLGRSRNRIYEVVTSDPAAYRFIEVYLNGEPGFAPSERLAKTYSKIT